MNNQLVKFTYPPAPMLLLLQLDKLYAVVVVIRLKPPTTTTTSGNGLVGHAAFCYFSMTPKFQLGDI